MKRIGFKMSLLVLAQFALSSAWGASADLACEKAHSKALGELITVAKTLSDTQIAAVMVNGKKSGIGLMSIDQDAAVKSFDEKSKQINGILGSLKCTSSDAKVEALKKMFAQEKYQAAAMTLNSQNGLTGVKARIDALVVSLEKAPPDVAVNNDQPANDQTDDDGNSETKSGHTTTTGSGSDQAHMYPKAQKSYPVKVASDGLWIVDSEHPVIPKKGPFHINLVSLPQAKGCQNLTRSQWQQVSLGRASCEGGSFAYN